MLSSRRQKIDNMVDRLIAMGVAEDSYAEFLSKVKKAYERDYFLRSSSLLPFEDQAELFHWGRVRVSVNDFGPASIGIRFILKDKDGPVEATVEQMTERYEYILRSVKEVVLFAFEKDINYTLNSYGRYLYEFSAHFILDGVNYAISVEVHDDLPTAACVSTERIERASARVFETFCPETGERTVSKMLIEDESEGENGFQMP